MAWIPPTMKCPHCERYVAISEWGALDLARYSRVCPACGEEASIDVLRTHLRLPQGERMWKPS